MPRWLTTGSIPAHPGWHYAWLAAIVLWLAGCATAPQPTAPSRAPITPALWHVSAGSNDLYLFGTVHTGRAEYYRPFPRDIAYAFGRAELVAVEADVSDREKSAAYTQRRRYAPPERLENHLPAPVLAELIATLPRGKATFDALRMSERRPLEVATNVASLSAEFKPGELSTAHGMELPLILLAKKQGKPVVEIEGFERAFEVDRMLSTAEEIELLQVTIERARRGEYKAILHEQFAAWERGDPDGLARAIDRYCNGSNIERANCDRLYDQRHPWMLRRIETYLQSGKRHFVMIGAGHLVGAQGLLALLRARGFDVRRANFVPASQPVVPAMR